MKKQKLQQLIFDVQDKYQFSTMCRLIMDGIESLNDFKKTMEWYGNMYQCLYSQKSKFFQWYLGERYCMDETAMNDIYVAVNKLSEYMGYELEFNANGFTYIKSK